MSAFGTWTARFANAILREMEDMNSLTFTVGARIAQIIKKRKKKGTARMNGWMGGWKNKQEDGSMDGPTDGRTDGWMDGWILSGRLGQTR